MRICIDVQSAIAQTAGVGRYTSELVRHIGPMTGDRISLFYFDFTRRAFPFRAPNTVLTPCRWFPGRMAQYCWKTFGRPSFDFFAGDADLYHFPNFIIPPLNRGKTVVTVHDMSFMRFPQFAEKRNLDYLTDRIQKTIARADAVITDSIFSANEIVFLTGTPREKVHAIHLGVSPAFKVQSQDKVKNVLQRLGINRPYLLTVGTIEPRKNIGFIVEMFEQMKSFDGLLVIVGRCGWKYQATLERIRKSSCVRRILHLAGAADADLPSLYAGSSLFVIASLYEGFGFPPVEAMACGTPVLSSTGGSLPEVLADAAALMTQYDARLWAKQAERILTDTGLRRRMIQSGFERAACFTWQETARKTLEVYRKIIP